jgi:predicted nucleotidyltransferase
MVIDYDINTDNVIQTLIAEAKNDPDVIGLVLLGSRAIGGVTSESDYDAIFVVTDEAAARHKQTQITPMRGRTIIPPIDTADIWDDCPSGLQIGKIEDWMLPAFAECTILYDRTGQTAQLIEILSRMPADQVQAAIELDYSRYLNGLYRSLKSWRRGLELGGRMEAAQTADYLIGLLYALERRWRPYSSRLTFHLSELESQGWQPGELHTILLDLISSGNPNRQQDVARRVIRMLQERGYSHVYDEWHGKIDQALSWDFPETP